MAKGAYIGVENFTPRTLPNGYTQIEYLESNGTQYIDTGFKHNQNTRICMDIHNMKSETTTWAFGGRISNTSATIGVFYWTNNSLWGADYNGNSQRFSFSSLKADDRLIIDYNKNALTINEQVHEFSAGTFQSTANLALLAVNTGGTVSGYMSAKLYSCKIYDNDTLIRDYVPCINSSGTAGLYDLVNGTFYTNAGTGTFAIGGTYAGVARKIKKGYIGIDGVARKIKKAYIGVGGVARPCWSGGELAYYGQIGNIATIQRDLGGETIGEYAVFGGGYDNSNSTRLATSYDKNLSRTNFYMYEAKEYPATATTGDYALFAGGSGTSGFSKSVNTISSNLTSSYATALTVISFGCASASVGNYALVAGGYNSSNKVHAYVNAYNASLTKTSPTKLANISYQLAGASVGNYALFAGGYKSYNSTTTAVVCAYDDSLTRSLPTSLSAGVSFGNSSQTPTVGNYALIMLDGAGFNAYDSELTRTTISGSKSCSNVSATTLGNYAMFGFDYWSDDVYVFDENLTQCEIAHSMPKHERGAAATIGNYAIFAGGSDSYSAYAFTIN